MGTGQSKNAQILKYVESQWQFLKEEKGAVILRNVDTSTQAQSNFLRIDPRRDIQNEYEVYNYRRSQQTALVNVYAVQNLKEDKTICGNEQTFKVITERIPNRYKDLPHLSFRQSAYALSESIRGYEDCFNKIGPFQITNKMIGVNSKGQVKVWVNENFALNHPVDEKPILQTTSVDELRSKAEKQQLGMLHNLCNVIEQKCDNGKFPEDFRTRIYSKSNFVDAYSFVEMYSKENNLQIPDRIKLSEFSSLKGSLASNLPTQTMPSRLQSPNNTNFYQPRQTLIQNLSFSQANRPYQVQQSRYQLNNQYNATNYVNSISPRMSSPPVKINFGNGNQAINPITTRKGFD